MMAKEQSKRQIEDVIELSDDEDNEFFSNIPIQQLKKQNQHDVNNADASGANDEKKASTFTILSWNIDGLEERGLGERTKAVTQTILEKLPDVVLLQEVILETYAMIVMELSQLYEIRMSKHNLDNYFNSILILKNPKVDLIGELDAVNFRSSKMGRHYLLQRLSISGQPVVVMTSHLESLKDHAGERQRQLKQCFETMLKLTEKDNVIFGGDLNLREADLKKVGGMPVSIKDAWEATGRKENVKFTWDLQLNDNKQFDFGKPRARYDRIYYKSAKEHGIDCIDFQLVGTRRLNSSCRMFPSDHFGLLLTFNV